MYADIDFKHPEVVENLDQWAEWFIETTGVEGFRLDAVKHIDSFFMKNFIHNITKKYGEDFYVFGEFWNGNEEDNNTYLEKIENVLTSLMFPFTTIYTTLAQLELIMI